MSIELLTLVMVGSLAGLLLIGVPYAFATGLVAAGTGVFKVYENRLGEPFAPIQDTEAFASCP